MTCSIKYKNFKCVKKIGEGTFSEIFLVSSKNKKLTVKVQKNKKEDNANEIDILNKLKKSCKNVLCIVEQTKNTVVSKFIDGKTLWDFYNDLDGKSSKSVLKKTSEFIKQGIKALEEIHSKNIVHLDIKPENIMVSPNGNLKLIDFGGAFYSKDRIKAYQSTYTNSYLPKGVINPLTFNQAMFRDYYAFLKSFLHEEEGIISPFDILKLQNTPIYKLFSTKDLTENNYKKRIQLIQHSLKTVF